MKKIADRRHGSIAQVALAWMLSKQFVTSILLGASKPSQLEDNLGALNLSLTKDELELLDKLTAPSPIYPGWFQSATVDQKAKEALSTDIPHKREAA
jgi:aryl-alcohol dehydrogenase-like predicted oxidoreductase